MGGVICALNAESHDFRGQGSGFEVQGTGLRVQGFATLMVGQRLYESPFRLKKGWIGNLAGGEGAVLVGRVL